jgi:choline monooxygenase
LSNVVTASCIAQARADLALPIGQALGLPGRFYGEAFYAIEQAKLFPSTWCVVTVGAAVPNPGDMVPVDLAGQPLLIVRGRDGIIRAFHNICRHRAIKLVGEARCDARLIRCPWHSWTYDLTGRLMATPQIAGEALHRADGFDNAELGLVEIPLGLWQDYVFVNLDGSAAPFEAHIAPLRALTENFDLTTLPHGGRIDELYNGNWKLSTESGIEDYHLIFGHPQMNAHRNRNTAFLGADGVYTGGLVSMAAEPAPTDPAALPLLATRDGAPWPGIIVFNVFPTGTVLITPDHLMIGMLMPDGPARTRVELHLYFQDGPDWDSQLAARDAMRAMWLEVLPQDFPFIEGPQATIAARDAAGIRTRFSPYWEQAVRHFQQMVLDAVI